MKTPYVMAFTAEAAIGKYRIVKKGANNGGVLVATAATEVLMGVTTDVDTDSGDICDVVMLGPAQVIAGGSIAQGARLTATADGAAVAAAPAGGANAAIVGIAQEEASSGDIFRMLVSPAVMQG